MYRYFSDSASRQSQEWRAALHAGMWLSSRFPTNISELFSPPEGISYPWARFITDHYFESDPAAVAGIERFPIDASEYELRRRKLLIKRDKPTMEKVAKLVGKKVVYGKRRFERVIDISIKFPGYDYEHRLSGSPRP